MAELQPTVLLVEDEPAQREILAYNLEAGGFVVLQAADGDEALLMAAEQVPDIILLDWMLPHVSGIEVCHRLRARKDTRAVPIIMISARSEEVDRVRGLETGADDYVVKPYSVAELMARVRTQLRRARPAAMGQCLEHRDIALDGETRRVTRNGVEIKLGPTEFRLLSTLGKPQVGLEPRAVAGPGVGPSHLSRCPNRGRACRALAQGADHEWRQRSDTNGSWRRIRVGLSGRGREPACLLKRRKP